MRKKIMAGAAVLALLMNSPQVKAEDEIVIFGEEFEDSETKSKEIKKPEPRKELPPEEKPAPPPPIEEEPPAQIEPLDKPEIQPLENDEPPQIEPQDTPQIQPFENEEPPQIQPQDTPQTKLLGNEQPMQIQPENDDEWGDTLVFDDLTPEQKPIEQPPQQPEYERPFEQPSEISNRLQERVDKPVEVVPPPVPAPATTVEEPRILKPSTLRQTNQPQQELKMLKPRFVKLAVDDTYVYYLDKEAVQWRKLPYSSSEYMADVWIRMVEREPKQLDDDMAVYGEDNFKAQIELAREKGYEYPPEDIKVLSRQAYILEHYYLRPKTRQVQFLCELEVFGRPQNTINERAYDAKNWENLIPGSVESTIYEAAIKVLGKSKASERGHMTFFDMLEEYGRISLR